MPMRRELVDEKSMMVRAVSNANQDELRAHNEDVPGGASLIFQECGGPGFTDQIISSASTSFPVKLLQLLVKRTMAGYTFALKTPPFPILAKIGSFFTKTSFLVNRKRRIRRSVRLFIR